MPLKKNLAALCLCALASIFAMTFQATGFEAHQTYISALSGATKLNIEDPASVLKFVLKSSAQTIHVQPTENYSYFKFSHNGLHWQGNMRLETEKGKPDKLHFAYFVVPAPWHDVDLGQYRTFDDNDGLSITALGDFNFRISFQSITRTFRLNDITAVNMPEKMLGPDQIYMGQVNDESGIRFFLLFDKNTLDFSYILDQQKPFLDKLTAYGEPGSKLQVGIRSGFVFVDEPTLSRKRLVGVHTDNISQNNYYDGPFDQLPDAFSGELTVKQAFALIDLEFSKKIDAYGNYIDQEGARAVIAPYLRYATKEDFEDVIACVRYQDFSVDYRSCIRDAVGQ